MTEVWAKEIHEFRESIKELVVDCPEDHTLLNLLKVTNMDPIKAKHLFKQYVDFRFRLTNSREMNFKSCIPAPEVTNDMIYKIIGVDYEGRLVVWIPVGRWEVRKLMQKGFRTEIFKHLFKMGDSISREVSALGKKAGKSVHIVGLVDFKELTLKKIASYELIQLCMELARMLDLLAPVLDKGYVINAPWVFHYLISLVKPVVQKNNLAKLEFLNSEDKYQEDLVDRIPLEVLPVDYGGLGPKVL